MYKSSPRYILQFIQGFHNVLEAPSEGASRQRCLERATMVEILEGWALAAFNPVLEDSNDIGHRFFCLSSRTMVGWDASEQFRDILPIIRTHDARRATLCRPASRVSAMLITSSLRRGVSAGAGPRHGAQCALEMGDTAWPPVISSGYVVLPSRWPPRRGTCSARRSTRACRPRPVLIPRQTCCS